MNGIHRHTCDLPVPVRIDEVTSAWSVDGMPVLLIPRHLWVGVQKAIEGALGVEAAHALFHAAGDSAARVWCTQQGERFHMAGAALFEHYLRSVSLRGYGQLTPVQIDLDRGLARVRIDHSVYAAEYGRHAGRHVCHMFESSLAGGLACASERAALPGEWRAQETACAANGSPHCMFELRRV